MRATRIKWEEEMAVRCLERVNRFDYELVAAKAADPDIPPVLVDIKAGEWDKFEYALSAALKK
jgi:hypothetical protein